MQDLVLLIYSIFISEYMIQKYNFSVMLNEIMTGIT